VSRRPTTPGAGNPKIRVCHSPALVRSTTHQDRGEVSVLLRRTVVWQDIFFQIEVFSWKGRFDSREIFLGSEERLTTRIPKLQQTRVFALGDALVVRGDQVVYWEDGGA